MKKTLCVFLAVLLLLFPVGCGERKVPMPTGVAETEMPTTTESTKETPAPPPEPTLTQTPEPTFMQTPTPAPTPTSTPTQTPSPESVPVGAELTDDDQFTILRNCLLRADAALAPLLGESATEGEPDMDESGQIWYRLSGYRRAEEMREELRAIFTQDLADSFFSRCYESENAIIREKDGHVYVRADSRDVLGHYYKIKYATLQVVGPEGSVYDGEYDKVLVADGVGDNAPIRWLFGFVSAEDGSYKIQRYQCDLKEEMNALTIVAGGKPYHILDVGSPTWLGEPERVEYRTEEWGPPSRTEYYDGLIVTLIEQDWGQYGPQYRACFITVTKPGIPTGDGVEVGDTKRAVLAVYPQFNLADDGTEFPQYPSWLYAEFLGDTAHFKFDHHILREIYIQFDVSN